MDNQDDFWGSSSSDDSWGDTSSNDDWGSDPSNDDWGSSSDDSWDSGSDDSWGDSGDLWGSEPVVHRQAQSSLGSRSAAPKGSFWKLLGGLAAILALVGLFFGIRDRSPATPTVQDRPGVSLPSPQQTVPTTEPEEEDEEEDDEVRYFGQKLPESYQKIYLQILHAVANFDDRVPNLILNDVNDLDAIVQAVFWDYGELFWFSGGYSSTYWDKGSYISLTLTPNYRWNKATCMQNAAFVESATRDFLAQSAGLSEYEKVKAVYNYLVDSTIYDYDYTGMSVYEQFCYGRAVCDAYARSTQYLLNKLGVEVIYVVGDGYSESKGTWESHAWNIVKVGGQYYQFDSTWGDPVNDDGKQTKRFTYLCVTTEEMARNHNTDWSLYPDCTATEYNYYIQEGFYLTAKDPERIKAWMVWGAQNGKSFEFKAANPDIYNWVMQELIGNKEIFTLFRESIDYSDTYHYAHSDKFYTVRITWQ